ncbi:RNA polymerase sigma factor [Longitalea luteola]|uniref:RNA polymerase sigma factor n=1 Tax=Longitalea luteola TaxID=2812563 RepID=UPI001A976E2C|nr:sigma-70 family RNA polymerase sigma factor [Longitalea luteola]
MSNTEANILYRFLQREEKAFEEVYTLFYGQLCYFAEKLVISRQLAEEIVVDVFVRTFRSTVSVTSMEHLRGYLFQAVKNQSLNYLKREKRYEQHLSNYATTSQLAIEHFENEMIETSALELIFQIAEGLPPECKRIFELLYKEQLCYQDIAVQLQLHIQTVRNQNARAIAYIRKKLAALR